MVRYDKINVDITTKLNQSEQEPIDGKTKVIRGLKVVHITKKEQHEITQLFLKELSTIQIGNHNLLSNYNKEIIIINPLISLDVLKSTIGDKTIKDFADFIKNYYIYNMDNYTNKVFGEKVIAVSEIPFSITCSLQNPNVITYEFLI